MAKSASGADTHTKPNISPPSSLLRRQSMPSIKTQYVSLHTDTLPVHSQYTHILPLNQQGRTLLYCGNFIKTAVGLPWLRALHQVEVQGRQQAGRFFLTLPEDHQLEQESGQSAATNTGGTVGPLGPRASSSQRLLPIWLNSHQQAFIYLFFSIEVSTQFASWVFWPLQQQVLLPWPFGGCCCAAGQRLFRPGPQGTTWQPIYFNGAAHTVHLIKKVLASGLVPHYVAH